MGPGDAPMATPQAPSPAAPAAVSPKPTAGGTDAWSNLLQFGLALMAGGDVQPGAQRGPTFAGALGQAGLSTLGDMRTRAALTRKEAKEDAAAAEGARRFGLTYGLSKEELEVKRQQAKETAALKEATLRNEEAYRKSQIGIQELNAKYNSLRVGYEGDRAALDRVDKYNKAVQEAHKQEIDSTKWPEIDKKLAEQYRVPYTKAEPLPVPKSEKDAVVGQRYRDPKGRVGVWNGKAFVAE